MLPLLPNTNAMVFRGTQQSSSSHWAGADMKKILAAAALALSLAPLSAHAQERVGDAALGALSGALVLGPIGAVAGAAVGYMAGPTIARSWGLGRSDPPPQRRLAQAASNRKRLATVTPRAPLPRGKPIDVVESSKENSRPVGADSSTVAATAAPTVTPPPTPGKSIPAPVASRRNVAPSQIVAFAATPEGAGTSESAVQPATPLVPVAALE
jgi:hypothetical protein